jgi:hypothetical protein
MNNRLRRVRAIELTLTPQQVVVVWLRNALQAGTLQDGARHSPPHRETVANTVYHTVQNSMKGQPEPLVERAILQARREADLLYHLSVNTNLAVIENWIQREREYIFLLGYLSAEMRGIPTRDRVQSLRQAFLMFIEPVIILDSAIAQVVEERLTGQPVLFRDCEVKLQKQLQMAETLSKHFNPLADARRAPEQSSIGNRSKGFYLGKPCTYANAEHFRHTGRDARSDGSWFSASRSEAQVRPTMLFVDELFTLRLANMKTQPKVRDLAMVKMFEIGYWHPGDIRAARNQFNSQNDNAVEAVAGRTTYQVFKSTWKREQEYQMALRARAELAAENGQS